MFLASAEDLVSHLEGDTAGIVGFDSVMKENFLTVLTETFMPLFLIFFGITIILLLSTHVFDILYLVGFPVSKKLRTYRAERIKNSNLESGDSGLGAYLVSSAPSILTITFLGGLGLTVPLLVSKSGSAGYQAMNTLYSPIPNGIALVVTAFVVAGSAFLLPNKVAPVKSIVSKIK